MFGGPELIVVIGGPMTVQLCTAGVESKFRLGSIARTYRTWLPGRSPPNSAMFSGGDAHEL